MSAPDFTELRRRIRQANHNLESKLLADVEAALAEHPTAVTQAQLEEARKAGALEVLRTVVSYNVVRQEGHPEEETRELDNVDIRRIATKFGVSTRDVWATE